MHKLIILFLRPEDMASFEARWSGAFVPLAEKMPGVRRITVSRIYGGPQGESDLHLVHEFYFDNAEALRAAMTSPEGRAAGEALMAFTHGRVSLHFAEHMEEAR